MAFSYNQKTQIIEYFSDPAHWHFRGCLDWLMDETRRWKSGSEGDLSVQFSPDKAKTLISHGNGSRILVERWPDKTIVVDETGAKVIIMPSALEVASDNPVVQAERAKHLPSNVELPRRIKEAGLILNFDAQGDKHLFLEDSGVHITFDKPVKKAEPPLQSGRFFHTIPLKFPDSDVMQYWQVLNAAKLTVAYDLGLEPELKIGNASRLMTEFEQENRPDHLREDDLFLTRQTWSDTTQFNGYTVDIPNRFAIEYDGNDYNLATTLDYRDRIIKHASLFTDALQRDWRVASRMEGFQNRVIRLHNIENLSTSTVLEAMDFSDFAPESDWLRAVIYTDERGDLPKNIRQVFANLGIPDDHANAMRFEKEFNIVIAERQDFERAKRGWRATNDVINAAEKGLPSGQTAQDFLNAKLLDGADLKYVDPKAAKSGYTLADLFKMSGDDGLLEALREAQGGIHPSTPEHFELVAHS